MDYSKFYTPPEIANMLVKELDIPAPEKVVDICCGSCNLLLACQHRWKQIKLFGVDVNEHLLSNNVVFEKKDGRQFAIEHSKEFKLVVANPPFDFVENRNEFPELFVDEFEEFHVSRLEVEMLIANLKLLAEGGVLLVILPSSFVEADSYNKLRITIAKNYYIESIIKLDESTFGASRINSYALIIHNELRNHPSTKLGFANKITGTLLYHSMINTEALLKGEWNNNEPTIIPKHFDIKRGNVSSAYFIKKGQPILHTAKYMDEWKPSIRYLSKKISPTVFAENGDIIVSRIGKSAGQWALYTGEKIAISDCLYRIKDTDGSIYKRIQGRKYNRSAKGVATRYITMSDFCSWIYSDK